MNLVKEIQENNEKIFQLTKEEMIECIKLTKDHYYNKEESLIDDKTYDLLEDTWLDKFQYSQDDLEIGFMPESNKVTLPYEMYSMNKIKDDPTKLKKFFQRYTGEYVISDKLDGVSALYINEETEQLYTRGNGKIGRDISYLLKDINIPTQKNVVLRGELIISKEKFEKYKKEYSSGRNFVSSIVNSKDPKKEYIQDIDLVFYEVIKPTLLPYQQMEWIKKNNYNYSPYELISFTNVLNNDSLKSKLLLRKELSIYEIDGIIVNHNYIYIRPKKNPSHAFAFKTEMDYQIMKTEVIDVEWNVSKDGLLKPKIKLIPIKIDNINIEYVSGYNGFYIESNKIGKGTKVEIIRSGDVIPVIRCILESTEPIFPQEEYEWDIKHVELILKNKDDKSYVLKKIIHFFKGMNIPMLGANYIEKLYNNGYDSIEKILLIKEEELETMKNISVKTSKKFYDKINERMKEITKSELLSFLNYLGRGYSLIKIQNIEKEYPKLFDFQEDMDTKRKNLEKINKKNAEHICEGLKQYEEFLKKIEIIFYN